MIAIGGWGGRNEKSGPMVRYRDGKVVLIQGGGANILLTKTGKTGILLVHK